MPVWGRRIIGWGFGFAGVVFKLEDAIGTGFCTIHFDLVDDSQNDAAEGDGVAVLEAGEQAFGE